MGDYIPGAPVDDEARKRNQSLPGQGGVFNLVNLHLYHYAGNNPVKHIDPDGKSDDEFDKFMMFLEEQDVKREFPNEAYKHEKIADNWNDLPESVKKYEPGTLWGNTVDDMGDHDHNQRLPGGYHLSEDKNYPGVYVHHDVIDPLKRPSETLDHKLFEADMAPDSSESRVDKYPDWK
jgi:hypothetical protein